MKYDEQRENKVSLFVDWYVNVFVFIYSSVLTLVVSDCLFSKRLIY